MNILDLSNIEHGYITGDIHGDFKSILYMIKVYDLKDCVMIVCGDIGLGFEKIEHYRQIFNKMTRVLSLRNVHVVLFRGNHDNAELFNGKIFKNKFIHVVPDYTVVKLKTNNILCIGGGISVDRTLRESWNREAQILYRLHHSNDKQKDVYIKAFYWEDEIPVYDKSKLDELLINNILINTVCTHSCPSFCRPLTKDGIQYWLKIDDKLSVDLDTERQVFDDVFHHLQNDGHPLKRWYYGHFHFHHKEEIEGVLFTLLDMGHNGKLDMVEIN